ncbi:DUF2285 domain-containing protein, partial [Azospirillum himalayense]
GHPRPPRTLQGPPPQSDAVIAQPKPKGALATLTLVRLSPVPRPYTGPGACLDPWWGASRQAIFDTGDGFHVVLADGPRERRFWIEGKRLPRRGTPLRALVALDDDLEAQVAALRRFHDAVTNPAAPPDLTPYQTRMLMRTLQALDANLDGASVRQTAEALFGAERVKADWYRNTPLRDQVRYLIRRGHQLMDGGYRDLLRRMPP